MPLVTAGSGIALCLPQNFRHGSLLAGTAAAAALPAVGGLRAVVSGSCSIATQGQVAAMRRQYPAFHVDPFELARGRDVVGEALAAVAFGLVAIGVGQLIVAGGETAGAVVSGTTLEAAGHATEELEETAKLFLLLRGVPTRPLSRAQIDELKTAFKLDS